MTPAETPRNNQTQAIIAKACEKADDLAINVQVLSKTLADQMQAIHGGRWFVKIDHQHRVVMIADRD